MLEIVNFSRSFEDWHSLEDDADWKKTFKLVCNNEKIKPIQAIKKGNRWWIGIKKVKPAERFNPKFLKGVIWSVGFGLGLVPVGFTKSMRYGFDYQEDMGYLNSEVSEV